MKIEHQTSRMSDKYGQQDAAWVSASLRRSFENNKNVKQPTTHSRLLQLWHENIWKFDRENIGKTSARILFHPKSFQCKFNFQFSVRPHLTIIKSLRLYRSIQKDGAGRNSSITTLWFATCECNVWVTIILRNLFEFYIPMFVCELQHYRIRLGIVLVCQSY